MPEIEPLSTRSETGEERALRFQLWLRQLKLETQAQIKEQERVLAAQKEQESSFVQISQESHTERLVSSIKAEFVNVLKVRKVVQKSLS